MSVTRRLLLLVFALGCGISILVSGRFAPRLILDGAVSFAFVPVCELAAFVVVYYTGRRLQPFAAAADMFLAGNTPWLWWLWGIMAVALALPVIRHDRLLPLILVTAVVPIGVSIVTDFRFSRLALGRRVGRAVADVIVQRAVGWSAAFACFLGIAIPRRDLLQLFVEMWDEIARGIGTL